ncbi:hypothetical protein ACIP5Y_23375 [Nocardia sp. NPDC088792]|uniref:hypothetical protein n=1 Tax=Nocardia sp. NPDC088792 TaxID=3364332 RepID=UPI003814B14D
MRVVDLDMERPADWVVRMLPAAALRGAGMAGEAARLVRRPPVTGCALAGRGGLERHRKVLANTIEAVAANARMCGPGMEAWRPSWQIEAQVYAEIGSACMDLAFQVEHMLLAGGRDDGQLAIRLVHMAFALGGFRGAGSVAAEVRRSYHELFDALVLEGRGRLMSA